MTPKEYQEILNWRDSVDAQLLQLHGGHKRLGDKLQENTDMTRETKDRLAVLNDSLGGFPEFMKEGHHTFKFVRRLITLAKWALLIVGMPIVVVVILTYGFTHDGEAPVWAKTLYHIWKTLDQ